MPPAGTNPFKGALKKIGDHDVQALMETFEYAYNQSIPEFERLEDLQRMYDNVVNEPTWPTNSKIPIPLLFTMVEKALPNVLDYLFPITKFIRLNPLDNNVDMDSIRKVEWALQHTIKNRMKLQMHTRSTIKDCFKLGVGYGVIEPIMVTPPQAFENMIFQGENEITRARTLGLGQPKRSIRYKYITPGQVVVTPDGNAFNGVNRVDTAFFIDTYSENEFKDLYATQPTDGERLVLKGDPEQIIEQARSLNFYSTVPVVNLIAALGGIDLSLSNRYQRYTPIRVPVLKVYQSHRHIWIANGLQIIFDESDKYQTLRTPLVRASAWPDGLRWYPMSTAEASQKMALGVNVWLNAMFDLMTHYLKPEMLYDKNKLPRGPERGPNADIGVAGDIRNAAAYIAPPPMPQGIFNVGDILQQWYGASVGQEQFLSQPQPGLMRGGAFSFESLLQSSTARERLTATILETDFLDDAIAQTLIYMQLNIGPEGDIFRLRNFDKQSGEEYIEEMKVTEEDLINAFELDINLKAKHRNSTIDQTQRLAEYNAFKGDEFIDQYELRVRSIADEDEARRLILPRELVRSRQEQNRRAELMERSVGIARAQAQASPTIEQQALAGAARVGGA